MVNPSQERSPQVNNIGKISVVQTVQIVVLAVFSGMQWSGLNSLHPKNEGVASKVVDQTFVVIGGGLAGLTSAQTLVDEKYVLLDTQYKELLSGQGLSSFREYSSMSGSQSDEEQIELVNRHPLLGELNGVLAGFQVVVQEKEQMLGGNSMKASSGINAVLSERQMEWERVHHSPPDSLQLFAEDTLHSCYSIEPPVYVSSSVQYADSQETASSMFTEALVRQLVGKSSTAISFLEGSDQISQSNAAVNTLTLGAMTKLGGHSRARTHRPTIGQGPPLPVGVAVITQLKKRLDMKPYKSHIHIYTKEQVQKIESDEDTCTVYSQTHKLPCTAVILATGGYSANQNLLQKYAPKLAALHMPTTNGPWATGDHITLFEDSAELVGMHAVQVHPTSFVDPKHRNSTTNFLAPEALRGSGGVLLNIEGTRFIDELQTRDIVARAVYWQPHHVAALVLGHNEATKFGLPVLGFYASKGFLTKVPEDQGIEGIIDAMIHHLNQKPQYKQVLSTQLQKLNLHYPVWVSAITPAIHYTMGGLGVDVHARVQKKGTLQKYQKTSSEAKPEDVLPRIYAVGESAGGYHGQNRLGGNSLLECVISGRAAAKHIIRKF